MGVSSRDPREEQLLQLATRLDKALAENAGLKARIAELEPNLGQTSRNSSKPPSSDGPSAPARTGKPTGKKRGEQPGHDPSRRELLPPEKVDRFGDCWPADCASCSAPVDKQTCEEPTAPQHRQVTELPVVRAHVTELRVHSLVCGCGCIIEAPLPAGVPASAILPADC